MCSELTPRARIPDTRIPQLMQPWLERSFPKCCIYCLSDCRQLHRHHHWDHDQSLYYGKHHREKALMIDDWWFHHDHQSLYGKHHREKAPSSESLHCGSPRLHTGREPICRASNAPFNYHCKAAFQFNYIIQLYHSIILNPSAEPVMLRLIIIAKPLFHSIRSSAGEN